MSVTNESVAGVARKIADVVTKLKPFQSLEYDPETGFVSIITELLVPGEDADEIAEILARCDEDEKVTVKRYADSYKVTLIRRVKL
jgi:pyruvate-formate lyase-activating enzyme